MGVIITKQGIEENSFTWEYYCDTYEDMESIAQQNVTIGSYCTLLNGENGVEIYAGDGNHQWVLITPSIRDKYSADNDGKVILNGNALSQTNLAINENGTYDTTLNNSIEVLVEPSLQNKTVTTNGVVTHDNNYYGLDQVTVNVPNSYEDEDEDKVVQNGVLVNQTSRTITENGTYDTTINNEVIITTENVYENSDEGKVVKNGELINQTSYSIDENGTYNTTEYNEIVVDIENTINLQSKTTTVNGEILPDNGYDGLSQVTVAVEGGATLQTKTIIENGTVEPDDGYDGFSEVTVSVSNSYEEEDEGKVVSSGELISQTSTTITENGTYDTTTYNEVVVNGIEVEPLIIDDNGIYTAPTGKAYSPVTVAAQPTLQSKTVTQNGTVTPDQGYDGLSSVIVNVSSGSEVLADTLYIINPDELDLYDVSVLSDIQKSFLIPGIQIGRDGGSWDHGRRILTDTIDGQTKNVFKADGWYHYAIGFGRIIPANQYSKLKIYLKSGGYGSDAYFGIYLCALFSSSTSITSNTYSPILVNGKELNYQAIKTVWVGNKNMTNEAINSQSGVTINRTSSGVDWQEVVVDISDITSSFFICFRDCDCTYSVRSMKLTAQ